MGKYKVLIVEDDVAGRKQLAKVIQKEGFEVITAGDGGEGLETLKEELPEIVVTDLKMPGMDGLEFISKARSLAPNIKIILATAFGETDVAIAALREGVLAYLKKPIDLDLLVAALEKASQEIAECRRTPPFPALLVVEDERTTRRFLVRALEKDDWEVLQAADGKEAMDIFRKSKIDIVLLDLMMPEKDGLQTLNEMRSLTHDFEAIILTGHGDESSAIRAMRDGVASFLEKPVESGRLINVIEVALGKLNARRVLKYREWDFQRQMELCEKNKGK